MKIVGAQSFQCVTVRTPKQLKRGAAINDDGAETDSTTSQQYVPDKDGFVPVVFVVDGDVVKAFQVETGIQSDTHIEIVSGISEGDRIVTGSYRAISQTLDNLTPVLVEEAGSEE